MTRRRNSARAFAARLGLVAVLFQAFLFGWHHHDIARAGRLPAPIVENSQAAAEPAVDEDGCEICQVLHHLTAAPVDIIAAPPPLAATTGTALGEVRFLPAAPALAFRSRAPPLA